MSIITEDSLMPSQKVGAWHNTGKSPRTDYKQQ